MKYNRLLKCSECGRILGTYPKYCPHCGGSPMTTDANPRIVDVPGVPKPSQKASAAPREQGNWWEPQNTAPSFSPPPIKPPPPTKTYTQPPPPTRTYTQPPPVPPQRPSAAAYEPPRPKEKAPKVKAPKIKPPISEQERLINKLSAASTAVVLIVIAYFLAGHYYDKWRYSNDRQQAVPYAAQSIYDEFGAADEYTEKKADLLQNDPRLLGNSRLEKLNDDERTDT